MEEKAINDTVELLPAFSWLCDKCGKRNFERAFCIDLPFSPEEDECDEDDDSFLDNYEEERMFLEEAHGPNSVKCKFCQQEFIAKDYKE